MTLMKATLGRLPEYLRVLRSEEMRCRKTVSATVIAKALNLGEVQVRKDLSAVSGKGKPKTGYITRELVKRLEDVLGVNEKTSAVIVGAGRLGKALLDYGKFVEFGVEIVAGFDSNPALCGENQHGKKIYAMSEFSEFVKENDVKIGVIAVPKSAAQRVCDEMIKSGIKAIWNFAPQPLVVPQGILLQQENLALSLAFLNSQLKNE
ncbi:MAG: redox-sensing transcriptional repressor Rex [Clostridia bacterium]|nr:redox-sensing transcriptional repressor Rex [Clostridia bacterium]